MRVVARIRLASGGGVTRAVTWLSGERVAALIDSPGGVLVAVVDTVARRVVREALIPRVVALEFDRVPGGLVLLAGRRSRIEPVRLATVDAGGTVRVTTIAQVPAGFAVRANGAREQQDPGLAVDPVGRIAYVVGGDRIFAVDLRRLTVSDPGALRTLAKVFYGSTRTAEWLGNGLVAVSGRNGTVRAATRPPVSGSSTCARGRRASSTAARRASSRPVTACWSMTPTVAGP